MLANGKNSSRIETGSCLNQRNFEEFFLEKKNHGGSLGWTLGERIDCKRIAHNASDANRLQIARAHTSQCETDTPMSGDLSLSLCFPFKHKPIQARICYLSVWVNFINGARFALKRPRSLVLVRRSNFEITATSNRRSNGSQKVFGKNIRCSLRNSGCAACDSEGLRIEASLKSGDECIFMRIQRQVAGRQKHRVKLKTSSPIHQWGFILAFQSNYECSQAQNVVFELGLLSAGCRRLERVLPSAVYPSKSD